MTSDKPLGFHIQVGPLSIHGRRPPKPPDRRDPPPPPDHRRPPRPPRPDWRRDKPKPVWDAAPSPEMSEVIEQLAQTLNESRRAPTSVHGGTFIEWDQLPEAAQEDFRLQAAWLVQNAGIIEEDDDGEER